MVVVGVDEAGKGPVLGSMFAAAVRVLSPDQLPSGVADSKALSPTRREALASDLRADDRIEVGIAEITAAKIDHQGTDMNTLTVDAHATAIQKVDLAEAAAIVDAADVSASRFADRIVSRLPTEIPVVAEHGADASYPVVSAASVVAKVERDAHVSRLAERYGEIGSGYPGDPTTLDFLREYVSEHGTLPDCARRSWQTSADVLAEAKQMDFQQFS